MKFSKFSELVNRILSNNHSHRRDMDVTIVVHSPGRIGSTPSVEVQSIQAGFDWDAGQVMIFPSQPLTTLTPEQVADITDSVRKGQSWHAYQEYKKHKEQLEKLSMELEAAKQREKDLFMENVRLKSGRVEKVDDVKPKPVDHGFRDNCECSSCQTTARICSELTDKSSLIYEVNVGGNTWVECTRAAYVRAKDKGELTRVVTNHPNNELKDHQIRELVNELRDIAVQYHGTQQLREKIARAVNNSVRKK